MQSIDASIVHFVIKATKLVQMIVSICVEYRVKKIPIVNPRWPPKIQDGRHENQLFDIFASWFLESDKTQRTKKLHWNVLTP